jgi:hypothetical protein
MVLLPGCECCFSCDFEFPQSLEVVLSVQEVYAVFRYYVKWPNALNPANVTGYYEATPSTAWYVAPRTATLSLAREVSSGRTRYAYRSADLSVVFYPNENLFDLGQGDRYYYLRTFVTLRAASRDVGDATSQATLAASSWEADVAAQGATAWRWTQGDGTSANQRHIADVIAVCRRQSQVITHTTNTRAIFRASENEGDSPPSENITVVGQSYQTTGGGSGQFAAPCVLPASFDIRPTFGHSDGRTSFAGMRDFFGDLMYPEAQFSITQDTLQSYTSGGVLWRYFPLPVTVSRVSLVYETGTRDLFADSGNQTC